MKSVICVVKQFPTKYIVCLAYTDDTGTEIKQFQSPFTENIDSFFVS